MTLPVLVFRIVTVRHDPDAEPALEDLSFAVAAGEHVALLGLNGAGKTSLLLTAVGLLPHTGEIEVCGITLSPRSAAEIRNQVGFLFNVPEDQLLFPRVVDDAAFALARSGVGPEEAERRAREALAALGADHLAESPVHHLSHGEKQRVALAGALVARPPLLLLDEPSAGLDPPGRDELARLLAGLPAAMLVATHELSFAARTCTRFLVLERGRLVADGSNLGPIASRWETTDPA